jgi:hypothetical protein
MCVVLFFVGMYFSTQAATVDVSRVTGTGSEPLWWEELITGAHVDESGIKTVLYVDIQKPTASDDNPGTQEKPYKSISAALKQAMGYVKRDESVKISIAPGVYREALSATGNGTNKGTLVIEGASKEGVIIDGADVWTGWEPKDKAGVQVAKWPYKWGMIPYPRNWETYVTLQDIVRRREIVYVDGKRMRQVLSLSDLKRGSFYVDEDKGLLYLWPNEGVDISKSLVEVGVRKGIGIFKRLNNFVLRNMIFQHDITPIQGGGTDLGEMKNALAENLIVRENNWTGIGFGGDQNITARNIYACDNGGCGMTAWRCENIIWENCEHSRNNWRGVMGNFTGWAVGGSKLLLIHGGIFRNIKSFDNPTHGFWFDSDCVNCLIDKAFWVGNNGGIFLECNQGPIVIRNSVIAFNKGSGIGSTNTRDVHLYGNIIYGNAGTQVGAAGQEEREVMNGDKKCPRLLLHCESWSLTDNVIATDDPSFALCNFTGWPRLLDSFRASGNLYYSPDERQAFILSGAAFNMDDWRKFTGQDMSSFFGNPLFKDAAKLDFTPMPGSPLLGKAQWPVSQIEAVGSKALAELKAREVKASWDNAFPLTQTAKPGSWKKLELTPFINHSMSAGGNGFVVGGLEHLEPGDAVADAIPFTVLNQEKLGGKSIIALKSVNNKTQGVKDAPAQVVMPIDAKVKAVYVLHGSGWTSETHEKVGRYSLVYEDGTESGVDIIAYGKSAKDKDVIDQMTAESNIADWWFNEPQFNNGNAHHVIVADPQNPLNYSRHIYILQIVNPNPDKKVKALKLESEGEKKAVLLIVAATALLNQ